MKTVTILVSAGVFAMLAGCSKNASEPVQPVQTVEWYKANKVERVAMLSKCNSNPGELAVTPNCVNATRADSATTWGATGGGIKPLAPITAAEINKK
jgi:hypothetical protein